MPAACAMTALASNTCLQERRTLELVRSALRNRLDGARMTEQARGIDRVVEREARHVLVPGRHVPDPAQGVVVDRRLEEESVDREQVGPAARVGADVVLQRDSTGHILFVAGAICQRGSVLLVTDRVANAGRIVREGAGDDMAACRSARLRHRGLLIGLHDRRMTGTTRVVPDQRHLVLRGNGRLPGASQMVCRDRDYQRECEGYRHGSPGDTSGHGSRAPTGATGRPSLSYHPDTAKLR